MTSMSQTVILFPIYMIWLAGSIDALYIIGEGGGDFSDRHCVDGGEVRGQHYTCVYRGHE